MAHFYAHFGISEEDIESISYKRVSVNFHSGRADVTINGEAVENGHVMKLEENETRTLKIKVSAKEGYVITGISYIDRDGNEQSVDGSEATFKVSASGSVSVFTKRINQDSEELGEGSIIAGATYMFYLTSDGDLYAWGDNRYGILGLGTADSVVRVPTYVMSGVAKVVTTDANNYESGDTTFSTAILTTDGRLLTVGKNTCGQLGRNGSMDDAKLGEVDFAGKIADVSLGHDHMLIVDTSGNLWGIGSNSYGALGTTNLGGNVSSFVKLDTKVAFASAGRRSTVYVKQDGTMWGLGDNRWNKMSQSHGEQIHSPVKLMSDIVYATSGEHQVVTVTDSGKLYYAGWRSVHGFNQGGGNNPTFAHMMDGVAKADIYFGNMVILTKTGDAYVYGLNTDNGIGDSAVTGGTPKKILSGVADVAAGYGFTAYLMKDGTLRIQGDNSFGQAGNGKIGGTVNMAIADL
jgi:alpha-tubulin suppressor-like RCC1 family protein